MKKIHKLVVLPLERNIIKDDLLLKHRMADGVWEGSDLVDPIGSYGISLQGNILPTYWKPQQLLLISDEKIKKGDWTIDLKTNRIAECERDQFNTPLLSAPIPLVGFKPIIASYPSMESLPTFSETFIKEWVNNPVMEVECQYSDDNCLLITPGNQIICSITNLNYGGGFTEEDIKRVSLNNQEEKDIEQAALDFANKVMPEATGAMKLMLSEIFTKGIEWYKEYLKSKQLNF
jgi:hypothetical protein